MHQLLSYVPVISTNNLTHDKAVDLKKYNFYPHLAKHIMVQNLVLISDGSVMHNSREDQKVTDSDTTGNCYRCVLVYKPMTNILTNV